MTAKDYLTTAHLKQNQMSSFDLVNYAIKLTKEMITSDRPCKVPTPIQNRPYQILLEIAEHKDQSV